jgi:hypothetical protein
MFQLPNNEYSFYTKVVGEKTQEHLEGSFTVKCLLSQAELVEVAIRTEQYNQGTALPAQFALINRAIAELEVRIIKSPTWWSERGNGRDLYDTNVVFHVFKEAFKAEEEWKKRIEEKAKEAESKAKEEEKVPAK